ncbi:MFS general substrate transporter [Polychaeton citri CBS 116435]|uniref:Cercosporin MFS transporter CTB4 n=1 Tax=Polychaeton citri CBS 116435 TaxID=1314669 RepID=A0A9P4UQJ1_9PEZI|nr:MFS general substrate transporter [Polychaeton citri CBS 116435]
MSARQSTSSLERKKSLDDPISTGATTPQIEAGLDGPVPDVEKASHQPLETSTSKDKEAWRVDFEDGDPTNPRNFKETTKARITLQLGLLAVAASIGSSITSPAQDAISKYTGVDSEVTVLTVSLYVLGFAFGPSIWAPLSEMFGRKWSMLPAMMALGLFSIGTAVSKNLASILVTRFFAGFFGCAPVSNVSAALGDMYAPKARGTAVTFYAVCVVGGPTLAPVIGAALTVNKDLGWRWTEYIEAIIVFFSVAVNFFLLPELYAPVLLKHKAQRLRKETGDNRYWHPHEELQLDFKSIVTKQFSRPIKMLFTEPMVTCIAIYASFVYALLYMTLEVFAIVFYEQRHWPLVTSTLPFLGLLIGVICAIGVNLGNQPRYARAVDANGGKPVPEARLAPMLVGGVLFAIGLFWFGWTANPKIFWLAPTIATAFIGAGFNIIFQQCINFLVDTYGMYAASATAANTFLRSFLAFAFPLIAKPMFHTLGVGPGMSLLGGIACLALPVPLIFMRFGPQLRRKSRFLG